MTRFAHIFLSAALFACGCQKIANHPPKLEGPIVAFGDSLTAGVGAEEGRSYPDFLSSAIGEPVVNRGISGNTTGEGLERLDRDVLSEKPRMVIVWLGANDALRQTPPEEAERNLLQIVSRIHESGALVVLVGVPDLPFRPSYNERIERLADQTGCAYVPNPLKGILIDPELKSDQIHPNSRGYERVAERIAKTVKKYAATS